MVHPRPGKIANERVIFLVLGVVSLVFLNYNIPLGKQFIARILLNDSDTVPGNAGYNGEPSYIGLCQAFFDEKSRQEQGERNGESNPENLNGKYPIIEEDPNLCINKSVKNKQHEGGAPLWTYKSLLSIFGSAFLSHAHSVLLHRGGQTDHVLYSHSCQDKNFIQGYLPEQLIPYAENYPDAYADDTLTLALEVCQVCLIEYSTTGMCSLFPSTAASSMTFAITEPTHVLKTKLTKQILPHLRNTTKMASESYRESLKTHSKGLWWDEEFVKKRDENLPNEDGAVVYISENDFDGEDTPLVQFYMFAELIARSTTTNIQIFATDGCRNSDICRLYSNSLKDYLLEMFPRAVTTIDWINPFEGSDTERISTAEQYARMALSSHLVCVTGDMGCTLAAAMKMGGYASVFLKDQEHAFVEELVHPNPFEYLKLIPFDELHTLSLHDFAYDPSMPQESFSQRALMPPPNPSQCRHVRGRVGSWVQDMEYAKVAQYQTPISYYAGKADRLFVPTQDQPFRIPSTYRWVDTMYPQCQTEIATLEGMCQVMQSLGLRRILFVGDSLMWHMAQSMHKLLGATDDADDGRSVKSWTVPFQCPNGSYEIQIQAVRNDELNNIEKEPTDIKKPNCEQKGFCMPWLREYMSNPVPTVVVANAGAHIQDITRFRDAFDSFVETVDANGRPDDIFFFRTTVPGHRDCMKEGIAPYNNFREYQERETKKWNWNMLMKHNDYVDRTLNDRKARGSGRIQIEMLDVIPMTVLRPDGHASSKDCANQCDRKDDCLHYSLPGPPDWWNHLLYSDLLDLVNEKDALTYLSRVGN
mmetsp:Transcript_20640/g.30334  ORF Transcript_20640/g.30334 Transcript_20640/m.30334 type:complete len:814 (+) Transcript_20640:44-2485(+)